MPKLLLFLLPLLPILFLACGSKEPFLKAPEQTEAEIIKQANYLIASKKYESAFKLLDNFDPQNSKPDIVLLKSDIVLNYFAKSIMHQSFALKDIGENEDIMDYRDSEDSFSLQLFQADSILIKLIETHPANCKLYKGLGEFYNEAYLKYGNRWLKDENELLALIQSNSQKAIDGNCADYMSYYILGFINLVQEKYKESIPYFLKSIEMNNDRAISHYNLAYSYLFVNDWQNALKHAKNALDMYTYKPYKSDAARMLGQIYTQLKDDKNALESYELADKIEPENYEHLKSLLNFYVKTGNKKADETAKTFFNLAPENPTIYNDLEEIYYRNEKEKDLIAFFKSQLSFLKDNYIVQGNLNFYLGKIYLGTDKKTAREHFLESKKALSKIFDESHQVFMAIEEGLKQCEE
jgi:tetratricopeptide (TPR) repeat protein